MEQSHQINGCSTPYLMFSIAFQRVFQQKSQQYRTAFFHFSKMIADLCLYIMSSAILPCKQKWLYMARSSPLLKSEQSNVTIE